jgi:hypothetical protein
MSFDSALRDWMAEHDPGAALLRTDHGCAVFADWLQQRDDPAAIGLGGGLTRLLMTGDREGYAAEHLAWMLGPGLGTIAPSAYRWGLPVCARVDRWTGSTLLQLLEEVRTSDPEVVDGLAATVDRWQLVGADALARLAGPDVAATALWPLVLPPDAPPPTELPPLRLPSVAIAGPRDIVGHGLAWLRADLPLETLVLEGLREVPHRLRQAAADHPTLRTLVHDGLAVDLPLPRPRLVWDGLQPGDVVLDRFLLLERVSDGATRRFFRAYDLQRGERATVASQDGFRAGRNHLEHVLPASEQLRGRHGGRPLRLEVYPADLTPLGPRPWSPSVSDRVAELMTALSVSHEAPEPAFLEQVFARDDGDLALVAPPIFVGERWQRVDIQRRLFPPESPLPWAGRQTRGHQPVDENGFVLTTGPCWVVGEGTGGNTTAEEPTARALARFGSTPSLEEDLLAAHRAARPRAPHEDGVTVEVAAVVHDDAGWTVGWVGEVAVFAVGASIRPLTTGESVPEVLGGKRPPTPRVRSVELAPDERLLICTRDVARQVAPEVLRAAVVSGTPAEAVERVLREAGRRWRGNAAVVVVDPRPE